MPLEYFAGQRLTADALQRAVAYRVLQDEAQEVSSSTTPVDTNIVVTVDDLMMIDLFARFQSDAGGFRWHWEVTSGITVHSRALISPGADAGGDVAGVTTSQFRQVAAEDFDFTVNHITTASSYLVRETLIVEGSGTAVFQFAQETSNAGDTTLRADSFAEVRYLGTDT